MPSCLTFLLTPAYPGGSSGPDEELRIYGLQEAGAALLVILDGKMRGLEDSVTEVPREGAPCLDLQLPRPASSAGDLALS